MKKIISLVLIFTLVVSMLALVGCQENLQAKINKKLDNIYLLDTPLSRFFINERFRKTNNSHLRIFIYGENESLDVDFFGKDFFGRNLVKDIEDVFVMTKVRENSDTHEKIECTHYLLELYTNNKVSLLQTAYKLSKLPEVFTIDAYLDGEWICAIPDDEYYNNNEAWAIKSLGLEELWDFSTGTNDVYVGVVDSGISMHNDLINNLVDGYDFTDDNDDAFDDRLGHGTHVAGIIGAVGNNEIGVSGVNWDVSLVPIQLLNRHGGLDNDWDIVNAIESITTSYEQANPIKILNMSFANPYLYGEVRDMLEGMLREYPGLVVCAAGNDGENLDDNPLYPAYFGNDSLDYPVENIIVVGSIDANDNRSTFSNFGTETVDIYAPGSNIYSTYLNNDYCALNGTSMAAPYVSGVAALLLSINPDLTTAELKDCILSGADYIYITLPDASQQLVKKLNAWGAFRYMLDNYTPSVTLGSSASQITVDTDVLSSYTFEKTPMIKITLPYSEEFTFTVMGVGSRVNAKLYGPDMSIIDVDESWVNNQWTLNFTEELPKGTYYLMPYYENTTGGDTITVSVSHEHTADAYIYFNKSSHIKACACGLYTSETSPHVVRAPSGEIKMAPCIYCGVLIDISNDSFPSIMSITKYSVNGSYILPNGVIVLVDEDVEAYLNGTLVFYDNDKLPMTQ